MAESWSKQPRHGWSSGSQPKGWNEKQQQQQQQQQQNSASLVVTDDPVTAETGK
ncbi:hypothetical protein M419DRAFT_120639 [Trichoderma reesei RUT C-30]|uniref:Uncharacterized protein n=1 Tax=Hypocrea jecorina (strain ATCC 56765 / BCRC 32924 / NRRL 11460 / Rut C-30) TaxID=1344414 RepID=A0A024RZV2_HYPJR|nr:hypothetical protein M419DRAFT_120639 [Trichoderma reesei RUT C-30]